MRILPSADRKFEDAIALAVTEGRAAAEGLQSIFDKVHEKLTEAVQLVAPFQEERRKDGDATRGTAAVFVEQVTTRSSEMRCLFKRQRAALGSVNLAFFGRTGAGKSSLIEAMTHGDGATVSRGESDWTTSVRPVEWQGCRLLDTPGINDERAVGDFVEPRLEKAVARWRDDQNAELDTLIANADAEVQTRGESRGGEKARRLFEGDVDDRERQPRQGRKLVNSLAEKAQKALRNHHEQLLGMKLDKARDELRKLDEAKTFGTYLAAARRRNAFRSVGEAERARKIVKFHTIVGTAGPIVMELGSLLWEEKERLDLEKQRVVRRQKLRDMIRLKAGEIGDNAWQDWEIRANEFKAWLSQRESAARAMSEPLDEELRMLNASKEAFTRLLAE